VHGNEQEAVIWGFTDQELHRLQATNYDSEGWFSRAGQFQLELTDIGVITAYIDKTLVGVLNRQSVMNKQPDVLRYGPIGHALYRQMGPFIASVRRKLSKDGIEDQEDNAGFAVFDRYLNALSRVLLTIRRQHHGGAVILHASRPRHGLRPKHSLYYNKLTKAVMASARWGTHAAWAWEVIQSEVDDNETVPAGLYFDEAVANSEREDAEKAELGAIATVASLSRIDGAILLVNGLSVAGFGVEILDKHEPPTLFVSRTAGASPKDLSPMQLSHFGTRHRSMARHCFANRGAIGFVVSQDGDVRAFKRVERRLVMWENILLQNIEFKLPSWKKLKARS